MDAFCRSLLLGALLVSQTGCEQMFGDKENRIGDPLGTYAVDAVSIDNSCGKGAMGSPEQWSFPVKLARSEDELYWDNGGTMVTGQVAEDGVQFSFMTEGAMDMRTPEDPSHLGPCVMIRRDAASGTLDDAGMDVTSFSGELTYYFEPTPESKCDDLVVSDTPLFLTLPCAITYEMAGTRVEEPTEE